MIALPRRSRLPAMQAAEIGLLVGRIANPSYTATDCQSVLHRIAAKGERENRDKDVLQFFVFIVFASFSQGELK